MRAIAIVWFFLVFLWCFDFAFFSCFFPVVFCCRVFFGILLLLVVAFCFIAPSSFLFFPLLLFQLAFALAAGHCFSRSAGLAHGSWSLRHFAYGFRPCGTLHVPNFVTRDRLDSQNLRFACPSVLLPPPSSKKTPRTPRSPEGEKKHTKSNTKKTQKNAKKTQKKHKKTQKNAKKPKKRKKRKKTQKKCKKNAKKLEVFLVFLNFTGCSGLLWRGPVFFLFRFRVFFSWSLSLLRWVLFFSRVF